MWTQSRYAIEFFYKNNIPFWDMSYVPHRLMNRRDRLLSNIDNTFMVVYLRSIGTTASSIIMTISTSGIYSVKWYNPRTGGSLKNGNIASILGGGTTGKSFGFPPDPLDKKDWVVLFRKV
jgi:hypothetical protein